MCPSNFRYGRERLIMPIIFETDNIQKDRYEVLIMRQLYINLGYTKATDFIRKWNVIIMPVEASVDFAHFFDHVEGETNLGIAWGVTMPKSDNAGGDIYCFINDMSNMFIIRSNFTKISHELAHGILYALKGRGRCIRKFDEPSARAGTEAPCYVTLVHDQFYGRKKFRTYWIRYKFMWLPVKMLDIHDIINRV